MEWKKFKKERISLNYTVMLLPHSQKKPIHFKTPVWTFGLVFLAILALSGACLFFAGSRHQLAQVQKEKEMLEQEWELLTQQKQLADEENENLRQAREVQAQELQELEQRTRNTIKELEELVEREDQIRQELKMQDILTEDDNGDPGPEGEESALRQGASTTAKGTGGVRIASTALPRVYAENTASFRAIQAELSFLQNSLSEKTGEYDRYLTLIEDKKEAVAAEKAQKQALRVAIVSNARQYIGNAYVYGGNDPHTGVDCSGFTRYILGHTADVYLNRTAAEQSTQGRAVSPEDARPGDLVFYSNGRSVNHVAIYAGHGRVVQASNERGGITESDMYYRTPVRIMNVLGD